MIDGFPEIDSLTVNTRLVPSSCILFIDPYSHLPHGLLFLS